MASIADYLRQFGGQIDQRMQGLRPALEKGFANPLTHAGLGIMMGSERGGPGAAAGFMQGMQGYNQFAAQQAQMQDQQMMRQLQAAQLSRLERGDKNEEATRRAVMEALRGNPQLLANNPLARTVLETTGDPSQLQGLGGLMPKEPTPMGEYQAGLLDIQRQRLGLDAQRYGESSEIQRMRAEMEGKRAGLDERRLGLDERRVSNMEAASARAAEKEARAAQAAQQKNLISRNDLKGKYDAAMAELDQYASRLDQFTKMKDFDMGFGPTGMLAEKYPGASSVLAPGVLDVHARRKEIAAQGGLTSLVELKGAGANLTPVSNTDLQVLQQKAGNLETAQSAEQARQIAKEMREQIERTKQRVTDAYKADSSLYDVDTGGGQENVSYPKTDADFNALPKGSLFVDPEDGKLYRK